MVWDIDSTRVYDQGLIKLRNKLMLCYLLVTSIILGVFSVAVYLMVARDHHEKFNTHLLGLANTSATSLDLIQHEYQELITEEKYADYLPLEEDGKPIPLSLFQLVGKHQTDSVFDLVANPLTLENQGVEWFDQNRQLLVKQGTLFPSTRLPEKIDSEGIWNQDGVIRSFILPVYAALPRDQPSLVGYVRVTQSTTHLDSELRQLQRRLFLGVVIVSGLVTFGGFWLTRESLKPVLGSFEQLKQFTTDAAHELRNPLTAIRASIAVMQSHPERIHPSDTEKLQAIASSSEQMSQLVDDLLLLTRMDRQVLEEQVWRCIALDEVLEDLVNLYSDRAEQAKIALKCQLTPDLEVKGDAVQLQRLFTNLLTNALQYTPSGGIITVSLQREGSHALISIQDTGIGIAPDQLSQIFDRFWRADKARSYHTGGTGLGLAIVKAVAQAHGGEITVQSQIGSGSCFKVILPLF